MANIPYASNDGVGLVKTRALYGLMMGENGQLQIRYAEGYTCKGGENSFQPVTPYFQHYAAFYGLAKAAGDSSQSASSNPVGTYTDDAKEKILKMLGIWDEIEWVRNQQ